MAAQRLITATFASFSLIVVPKNKESLQTEAASLIAELTYVLSLLS